MGSKLITTNTRHNLGFIVRRKEVSILLFETYFLFTFSSNRHSNSNNRGHKLKPSRNSRSIRIMIPPDSWVTLYSNALCDHYSPDTEEYLGDLSLNSPTGMVGKYVSNWD